MEQRPAFEEIEHTADLALLIRGATLPELFTNAARAMFLQMGDVESVQPVVTRRVKVSGVDIESLLVAWLNQLLYLAETRHEVYTDWRIHFLSAFALRATVRGGPASGQITLIKGATYHNLAIEAGPQGYQATVVLDV